MMELVGNVIEFSSDDSRYKNIKFVLISPEELRITEYIKEEVWEKNKIEYIETNDMEQFIEWL